ncbi:MAG TPA: 3-methyladenine DNA glycosylase [Candidatus Nanopelagicaceae bacterium]|nr:3-methyladenine DNA glycosylase [Candidatus Nanopelagicaceae bacterium]
MAVLDRVQAAAQRTTYASRVDSVLGDLSTLERLANPVEAFLWTYYSYRPRELRRYHVGALDVLSDEENVVGWRGYGARDGGFGVRLDFIDQRRSTLEFITGFLQSSGARTAQHNCFGMHEWAMVHGQTQEEIRHAAWPLRLGSEATTKLVDQLGVRCTHFDAFRFFTPSAKPLNAYLPTRESQRQLDQPGCIHANMDLYKWAYKLSPILPSDLVLDAFVNARRLREIDMRASPYDLGQIHLPPIQVETPEGRLEYASEQRRLAAESMPIRDAIVDYCKQVMVLLETFNKRK